MRTLAAVFGGHGTNAALRHRLELPVDADGAAQHVEAISRHTETFPLAGARARGEHNQGAVPGGDGLSQSQDCLGCERHDLWAVDLGQLHPGARARGDETISDGRQEDGSDIPVNELDGSRSQYR